MTNNTSENLTLVELLDSAQSKLDGVSANEGSLREAAFEFSQIADAANMAASSELFRGSDMFSQLLEIAACWCTQEQGDPDLVNELIGFVQQHMPTLEQGVMTSKPDGTVDAFVELAQLQWAEYFALLGGTELQDDSWSVSVAEDAEELVEGQEEIDNISSSQIEQLLSVLSDSGDPTLNDTHDTTPGDDELVLNQPEWMADDQPLATIRPADVLGGQDENDDQAKSELAEDREMLEAYLDDALRCLSSMEQAALEIETSPDNKESVGQFCRELHTLKGASATVGLAALAAYLHELESSLEKMFDGDSSDVKAEPLFEAVDRVRDEIGSLKSSETEQDAGVNTLTDSSVPGVGVSKSKPDFSNFASGDESSIRIRVSKLDRLMDMLAELVVLRNRRESHVAEFNVFNEELARCASRLGLAEEQMQFDATGVSTDSSNLNPFIRNSSCTFTEVAKDITEVSKGMRELHKPVSQDNSSISRFIRDFRQELMQLRRIPVSGLFNRLQRAARDAAKSENKQVQIRVVGENAGLEQEIQERLFESLLHVVRNSVSHGLETVENRVKAGKPPTGVVTLEASSSAQLLIIDVRDDGNGIDHEAVRKRAIEKGLLPPNTRPTNREIAQLIFHPGFSTREQASAVSGRGVGMDIVAKTIDQLHGRVDVDSIAGQGTTIRLSIPLRTGIEHVMVFRSGGQLFALPMQSVTAAKSANTNIGEVAKLSLSSAISGANSNLSGSEDVLLLRQADDSQNQNSVAGDKNKKGQLALAVDELVGPEEVVVRGLPNLLRHHPLFCGVTLSGSGEKVLLLESDKVLEFCNQFHSSDGDLESEASAGPGRPSDQKRALVVDDSLTARRALVKILKKHGFATAEAGDGIEAVERLHKEEFDLVLTDLDMPRFGGLELLSDIQSSRYCEAPVVVVSSRNEEAFRTKAMDVGASDYVTKPVSELSISQLLDSLELLPETSEG